MTVSPLHLRMELAYHDLVLFAIELLDAVTLERVSQNIKLEARGLKGAPVVNTSGLFVWLQEDFGQLRSISIDPGMRPYERVELAAAQVERPLTTVELPPRIDYPFPTGVTGLRGTLIERRVIPPEQPEPVGNAAIRLRWLDEDGHWQDAPTTSRTAEQRGDFVSILRLASTEKPDIDESGSVTAQLLVTRDGFSDRSSADLKLPAGRITNPSSANPWTFAWDELTP